jgi:hypothetical protein
MKNDPSREMDIFSAAIKVPLEDQATFLEHACRGDEDLRRKLEALLKAHNRIGNFLEEPPTGAFME